MTLAVGSKKNSYSYYSKSNKSAYYVCFICLLLRLLQRHCLLRHSARSGGRG